MDEVPDETLDVVSLRNLRIFKVVDCRMLNLNEFIHLYSAIAIQSARLFEFNYNLIKRIHL